MKVSLWAEIRRLHEVEGLVEAGHRRQAALLPLDREQGTGYGASSESPIGHAGKCPGPLQASLL